MTIGAVNKDRKRKENFAGNRAHNIFGILMFYQIFFSQQVKQSKIIFMKHGIHDLLQELLNYLKLKT